MGCGGGGGSTSDEEESSPPDTGGSEPPASTSVIAHAGLDQAILVGQTATLDGSQSEGATSYRWTLTLLPAGSAASIVGGTSVSAFLVPDVAGAYTVQLSINGGESIDTATITASETLGAVANAGIDQSVFVGKTVTLDGSTSLRSSTAQWTFVSTPTASSAKIANSESFVASFVPDVAGQYVIELSVNGGENKDTLTVTASVETAKANAGSDQDVVVANTVALNGSASTGVSSARWAFVYKPGGSSAAVADATSLVTSFIPDKGGDYILQLSINGGESIDTVTISATSVSGSISTSSGIHTRERFGIEEYAVDLGTTGAMLTAEDLQVADGQTITSYEWEQIAGPQATMTSGTTGETLEFTAPTILDFYNKADHYKWQILAISREDTKMTFRLTAVASDQTVGITTLDVYLEDSGEEIHETSGIHNIAQGSKVYLAGPSYYIDQSGMAREVTDWTWKSWNGTTVLSTEQVMSLVVTSIGDNSVTYFSKSAGMSKDGGISFNVSTFAGAGVIGGTTAVQPQCGWCHSASGGNSQSGAPKYVEPWLNTRHASIFEQNMEAYADIVSENGGEDPYLWPSHTVGYNPDANTNNGFDDLASLEAFVFPSEGLAFDDFVAEYPLSASRSNVQCENCHGPGNDHSGNQYKIAYSFSQAGVCGQCHTQEAEWVSSRHNSTGVVDGNGAYQDAWLDTTSYTCVRCHYSGSFVIDYLRNVETQDEQNGSSGYTNDSLKFPGVTCQTCHSPHTKNHDKQLRLEGEVEMAVDGSTVDAGRAAVCYQCHDGFYVRSWYNDWTPSLCDTNGNGVTGEGGYPADTACTSIRQAAFENSQPVHLNNQAPVLEGKGAILDLDDDGQDDVALITNSKHGQADFILPGNTENLKCVTCHMATGPTLQEDGYRKLGGHAFSMRSGDLEFTKACTPCHGEMSTINRNISKDFDGDGVLEGIQDEVKGVLLALAARIKTLDPANVQGGTWQDADGIHVAMLKYIGESELPDGKTCSTVDVRDDYAPCNLLDAELVIRSALWNHNFMAGDRSFGVHNVRFIVRVLQETYTALADEDPQDTGHTFSADYPNAYILEEDN